ncbi:MAG: hypothetical protein IJY88_00865, partial [Clostridia bacterium]|nr:hypothetical protein [Clostridia bacterium]
RYVKSKTVQAALEEAFRSFIPRGKFPGCVLFVSLLPELTDVNVHPAKTEIKFASERDVFRAVYYAVKNALEAEPEEKLLGDPATQKVIAKPVLPELPPDQDPFAENGAQTQILQRSSIEKSIFEGGETPKNRVVQPIMPQKTEKKVFRADLGDDDVFDSQSEFVFSDSTQVAEPADPEPKAEASAEQATLITDMVPAWRMIGQAYDSYIFVETEENILIIDKHAAHERVLYEKLAKSKELHIQELLSGVPVNIGREQAAVLLENADFLEEKGFKIEDFGEGALIVRTVPATLGNLKGLNTILEDFARTLSDGNGLSFAERCDRALYTVACKAALKARIKNRPEDDENVVRMLAENPHLRYCPHGRPFIKKLPKREIEKYFDR